MKRLVAPENCGRLKRFLQTKQPYCSSMPIDFIRHSANFIPLKGSGMSNRRPLNFRLDGMVKRRELCPC